MSRKFIVAIAAVAALGMSTLLATDAFARGGGGGGHGGGGHGGGFHGGGFSRSFHQSRVTTTRHVTRTTHTRTTHTKNTRVVKRPNPHRVHLARHHHRHHWVWSCGRHHDHCRWIDIGVDGGVDTDVVTAAPQPVAATPSAAVCTNECDYFLKDEPGCYMAKRAFSTPAGDELRCVKICDEAEGKRAEK
jgi:hypothetical protein